MQDIGAGRLVNERYLLGERRAHLGDLEVWRATSNVTGAAVYLTVFPLTRPHAEEILDAARRCSALRDPRLIDVIDVGRTQEVGWFVEESFEDAVTLTQLLDGGPVPGEEARRIVGEIAEVLDLAASMGLHHLHVTPHAVRRKADGGITLAGLAIAGAIEGDEQSDATLAQEIDTRHTLALGYAALTTRWPLPTPVPGLEQAPRIVGGVAAPSEIAVGVPADLDALCRQAFNGQHGPRTLKELAAAIAPWSRHPVGEVEVAATSAAEGNAMDDTQEIEVVREQGRAAERAAEKASARTNTPTSPLEDTAIVAAPVAAAAALASRTDPEGHTDMAGSAGAPDGRSGTGNPGGELPPKARPSREAEPEPQEEAAVGAGTAGSEPTPGARGAAVSAKVGAVSAAIGSFARAAADRAAAARQRLAEEAAKAQDTDAPSHAGLSAALGTPQGTSEPEPVLFQEGSPERDGTHARLVLMIVAAFVVIALILALPGLFLSRGGDEAPAQRPGVASPASPSASSAAPSASGTGSVIRVVSGTGFDPEGDARENGASARLAFDGDPQTSWTSEGYNTGPQVSGKRGVGVVFTLPRNSTVSSFTLTLPTDPQDVSVYANGRRSLTDATELANLPGASGTRDVTVTSPQESRYLIVWFTSLARDGDRYRASLPEIALRG